MYMYNNYPLECLEWVTHESNILISEWNGIVSWRCIFRYIQTLECCPIQCITNVYQFETALQNSNSCGVGHSPIPACIIDFWLMLRHSSVPDWCIYNIRLCRHTSLNGAWPLCHLVSPTLYISISFGAIFLLFLLYYTCLSASINQL